MGENRINKGQPGVTTEEMELGVGSTKEKKLHICGDSRVRYLFYKHSQ